jgi:hypothetical protein
MPQTGRMLRTIIELTLAALGVALTCYASREAIHIARDVNGSRLKARLPPLPCRHFLDFAEIASIYADAAGNQTRVARFYAVGIAGPALFVASVLPLLIDLHLPR